MSEDEIMQSAGTLPAPPAGFAHEALMYAGLTDFLRQTVPFLTEGLDAGEPALVALPQVRVDALRKALGQRAGDVQFVPMELIGRNPSRIIAEWHAFVEARPDDGRSIRGIGEPIWATRSPAELAECHVHESLLNDAFAETSGFTLLCPYDTDALDAQTLQDARCTHPVLRRDAASTISPQYSPVAVRAQHLGAPLPAVPASARLLTVRRDPIGPVLGNVRRQVAEHARGCGAAPRQVSDLVLAVHEVTVNAIQHDEQASVAMWCENDAVVCEVRNATVLDNPMAGRRYPGHSALNGRGLWLVNRICDFVQIRSGEHGTAVRVQVSTTR